MSVVKEYGDVREIECPDWQTHYVIDCQGTEGGLALFAGQRECVKKYVSAMPLREADAASGETSRGAAAIIQAPFDGDWTVEQTLRHFRGHTDIMRGCQMDMAQGTVVSCGEDGLVCLWSAAISQAASADTTVMTPQSEGASPAVKPLKVRTHSSDVGLCAMLTVPAVTSGRHRRERRLKQRGMHRTDFERIDVRLSACSQ